MITIVNGAGPKPSYDLKGGNIVTGTLFTAKLHRDDAQPRTLLRVWDAIVDLANPEDTFSLPTVFLDIVELDGQLIVWPKGIRA